jgi:hypothetical protein
MHISPAHSAPSPCVVVFASEISFICLASYFFTMMERQIENVDLKGANKMGSLGYNQLQEHRSSISSCPTPECQQSCNTGDLDAVATLVNNVSVVIQTKWKDTTGMDFYYICPWNG